MVYTYTNLKQSINNRAFFAMTTRWFMSINLKHCIREPKGEVSMAL